MDQTTSAPGSGPKSHDETSENDIPSCQGCRRRKLRCSRDQPICSHCKRLDSPCVYDLKKNKPGIKPGAVESLNRRVEVLENALLQKSHGGSGLPSHTGGTESGHALEESQNVVGILSLLARELHKLTSRHRGGSQSDTPEVAADHAILSPSTSSSSRRRTVDGIEVVSHPHNQPRKRRRVDSCGNPNIELAFPLEDLENITTSLPPPDLLEDIINIYFNIIHPWIPILHETVFRRRVHDPEQLPVLVVVLHAMVVTALRYVDNNTETRPSAQEIERTAMRSRNIVILNAMNQLSVENLQALIILAFNDIGNGDVSKAWSIVGSLTRTVEYLQLSVESDNKEKEPLLKPLPSISPPQNWTEEEERRRVFWNIFNLDRWNTSLTSDDVHRRLPADGGLWHKEEAVITPFFGIWDRSAAKMGNSIVFLPEHYPSPEKTADVPSQTPVTSNSQKGQNTVDMTTVGAFSYCIEATESLSRVTTYFLQQKIDFEDRGEVSCWLTRFKELDLRLVHWKMFLPQKWKDSNISRQPALINMDPNLTLAHVTHNTSMILLHQRIAYPEAHWSNIFKLPSFCSAETCQEAAIETTTITQKYLKYTPDNSPATSQFAFCVFISARVLLVHWRYYDAELAPEFWVLVESMEEMARRWVGPILREKLDQCLAGKYAARLRELHRNCEADPHFNIDVLGYSSCTSSRACSPAAQTPTFTHQQGNNTPFAQHSNRMAPRASLSSMAPNQATAASQSRPPPIYANQQSPSQLRHGSMIGPMGSSLPMASFTPRDSDAPDELSAISHMLMDQRFMEMDRIISFDDMMFTAQTANNGNSGMPVNEWGQVDDTRIE
ncbi:fungal-specific transcription factor domain-containing protein [Colletotrichum navitas]|uniref:Fungal-specific transcription factor domain-containing protein n=1 Tax=Colletotrichum navitas TaxID=681940 RepID=A0AAD8V1E0_9PEZI|nr:fungal-specific transcription factor domain-containing protein [Colletotrichum navitas]KAK1579652.1 fungal-specific transcription factor domain-containing protein [Colletotrichum navitas]